MSSGSSFQHSALYERLYALRLVIILVAVVLVIAVIVVWLALRPHGEPEIAAVPTATMAPAATERVEGTEAAKESPTVLPTPTDTPTIAPPTDTPQPSPTSSPTAAPPTATAEPTVVQPTETPPLAALPKPLKPFACPSPRVNDFSSGGGFGTGSATWARWGVDSGEYYLAMQQADSWGWQSDGVRVEDAILEADVRQAAEGAGAFGLAFGGDSLDNGQQIYGFVISPDGQFGLYRHTRYGKWIEIQPFTYSYILYQGDQTNRLRVVRSGPLIALYANGMPLATTYRDENYMGAGYAGFVAWSNETAGLEARFDNYSVCRLTEPPPLPVSPFAQRTLHWPAGQPAMLHWAWFATTEALAQSFADLTKTTLTLDGQAFFGLGEYWSEPGLYAYGYAVQWDLPLPPLAEGKHRIEIRVDLLEQITDGFDVNGDGQQDTYGPGEAFSGWVELNVEE